MGPCHLCDSLCVSGAGRHSEFENVTRLADSFPDAAVTTITIANVFVLTVCLGLLRWLRGKETTCQCGRHRRLGFNPWVGKIPLG